MLGKEAALFAASGTQTNLLALLTHCDRGDEYIVGQQAHTYRYEGGGAAVLGSIQPQPLEFEKDATLDLDRVAAFIKPDDFHFARTRLLCLENTQAGKLLPMEYLQQARSFCEKRGLKLHLDGARIFNAAVKQDVQVKEIADYFDTVSVCLSKGLGAPVGSLLCGSREQIHQARRWRKMLGGGMRQAGILAAAGIHALQNNINRLADDHANAARLAEGLGAIEQLQVEYPATQTNMVYVGIDASLVQKMARFLQEQGVLVLPAPKLRLVTHLDVGPNDIDQVVRGFRDFFTKNC
jgi:threonine aldolase